MKLGIGRMALWLGACGFAAALSGCASRSAISFHVAAPVAVAYEPAAQVEAAPQQEQAQAAAPADGEQAQPIAVTIGNLPPEDVALLDNELSLDSELGFQLSPHKPASLSFHCISGEESLGCAAKPAVTEDTPEFKVSDEPAVVALARNPKEGAAQ